MTSKASMSFSMSMSEAGENSDFGGPFWNAAFSYVAGFADGTGANQVDLTFADVRTVADGVNDDLDLNASLQNALGDSFDAAELVALAIINKPADATADANTTALTVGGATNPIDAFWGAVGDTVEIGPGGMLMLVAPDANGLGAITAGTADNLRIANAAGAANTYQIGILARSA